jgi:hypothetical protein
MHPGPPRKKLREERVNHRYRRDQPGLPCAVVLRLIGALPGEPAFATVILAPPLGIAEFSACMGAPGPHDFAVRDLPLVSRHIHVHRNSAPRFVTTRNAPHAGAEWEHLSTIPKKRKKNFIAWRLATRIGLKRLTKLPASSNHVFRAFGMREPLSLPEVAPIRPTGKMAEIEPTHD